jgi:hypothetical protein
MTSGTVLKFISTTGIINNLSLFNVNVNDN